MIQTIHFSPQEVPLYLKDIHVPTEIVENRRFHEGNLRQLYKEFRYYSSDKGSFETLDS